MFVLLRRGLESEHNGAFACEYFTSWYVVTVTLSTFVIYYEHQHSQTGDNLDGFDGTHEKTCLHTITKYICTSNVLTLRDAHELVGPKCRVRHGGSFKGVWSSGEHRPLQLSRGPAAILRSPPVMMSSSSSSRSSRSRRQDTIDLELYYADDGVTLEGLRDVNINQLGAQYHAVSTVP